MVAYQTSGIFYPWDSPGKNIGVGCHALLQGIFPTQGSNLGWEEMSKRKMLLRFLHGQAGSYPLSHMASQSLMEAINFIFTVWETKGL